MVNLFKNEKVRLFFKIIGVSIVIIIAAWISFILYSEVWNPFYSEAKEQKEYRKDLSAGDCRFVNTAYAYDNDLNFEVHSFIFKVIPSKENNFIEYKKGFHVYAVDANHLIYDKSNNHEIIAISYNEFIKNHNIVYDELLLSGSINKNKLSFKVHRMCDDMTIASLISLPIYYIAYKINR